jgi:hypothetical protein
VNIPYQRLPFCYPWDNTSASISQTAHQVSVLPAVLTRAVLQAVPFRPATAQRIPPAFQKVQQWTVLPYVHRRPDLHRRPRGTPPVPIQGGLILALLDFCAAAFNLGRGAHTAKAASTPHPPLRRNRLSAISHHPVFLLSLGKEAHTAAAASTSHPLLCQRQKAHTAAAASTPHPLLCLGRTVYTAATASTPWANTLCYDRPPLPLDSCSTDPCCSRAGLRSAPLELAPPESIPCWCPWPAPLRQRIALQGLPRQAGCRGPHALILQLPLLANPRTVHRGLLGE